MYTNNNNNNKRDIDKEITDNNIDNEINKKQKLDNNNNENNDNNDIDISNLKQHTVNKLKEIAASVGLQHKSSVKKQDLIDQITYLLNKKQESIKQKEIDDNVNSFNKVSIEFKIKDGVDESEWLFWRIFRNKFIFRRIMSFMDTHFTQTYESIISVEKMIKSNQLYILRDKVIRNQYLVFKNMINTKFKIFDHFKQDELFYKSFFKNYNKYIPGFNEISNGDSTTQESKNNNDNIINGLIDSKNYLALNILITDYNFKPTNANLIHSIKHGKLKFIKLFLQPKFKLNVKDPIEYLKKNQFKFIIKIFKSLNYLYDEKLIEFDGIGGFESCLSIEDKTTLKELISIIKFIINSTTTDTLVKDQQQQQQYQQMQQLIDLNQFTKEELKLEITSASLANHKQSLKSLIEFYYKFGKSVKSNDEIPAPDLFYHLYLCDNESVIVDKLNRGNIYIMDGFSFKNIFNKFLCLLKVSLQCASFKALDHVLKHQTYSTCDVNLNEFILSNPLFTFCKHDKEKQTIFLNMVIKEFNSKKNIFKLCNFICILIAYDDVELVKHYLNDVTNLNSLVGKDITSFIKSNEMLEYLFDQHYSLISNSIFLFQNVQLLYKFEELYKKKFINTKIVYNYSNNNNNNYYGYALYNLFSTEILIHILSTPSIYKIQSENLYSIIKVRILQFSNDEIFQMCKLVYLNYQVVDNYVFDGSNYQTLTKSIGFIKFIDWLFKNNKQEDINHYFQGIALELFRAGRYNSIYKDQEIPISQLKNYISFENIKLLDYYLNRLASTPAIEFSAMDGTTLVTYILTNCIDNGRLKSLEHIYQNHNWVFRTSITTNNNSSNKVINGYTTNTRILKNIFLSFLRNGYLELSEIIFQIVSITQNEFYKNANDVSNSFFKNKKFK